jgi:hypothetical protein
MCAARAAPRWRIDLEVPGEIAARALELVLRRRRIEQARELVETWWCALRRACRARVATYTAKSPGARPSTFTALTE